MKAAQSMKGDGMSFCKWMLACCVLTLAISAKAQTAEERYIADRDAAIARFTPERVPKIEKPQMDEEEKARLALEQQLLALIGATAPKGFAKAKSNLGSLFTGDMDFGKLDGLVFEADGGKTELLVTTMSLLQRWLKPQKTLPADPDAAMRMTDFLMGAIQTDAAILQYAEIPLGMPRAFAMLANRTQDNAPAEAREIFVTAIRGDRVYVAHADLEKPMAITACSSAHLAAEKKVEALSEAGAKPGESNEAFSRRLENMREQADADFLNCFAERAPKDPRFAAVLARARDLYERMPAK
jgi:hypothetical protein